LLLLNAHHEPIPFTFPPTKPEQHWERLLDTAAEPRSVTPPVEHGGEVYELQGRSVALFRTRLVQPDPSAAVAAPAEATLAAAPAVQP
jgi:glycogen operon protein